MNDNLVVEMPISEGPTPFTRVGYIGEETAFLSKTVT
jgi:hypothetical protein